MSFGVCPGHNRRLHQSDGRFFCRCSQCARSRRADNSPPPRSLASASSVLVTVSCGGCGSFTVPLVVHGMTPVSRGPPHPWPDVVSPATGAGENLSPLCSYTTMPVIRAATGLPALAHCCCLALASFVSCTGRGFLPCTTPYVLSRK